MAEEKEKLVNDTRKRFSQEYLQDNSSSSKYDSRDVERLQNDDSLVEGYLLWRHNVMDDALKMIDESFRWRKDMAVNDVTESAIPRWCFEVGAVYLHGYDKEGNKLFWFRVKLHFRDAKTMEDKKKCVAFWLERYFRREPGKLLTVVFDMAECGLSNVDMEFVRFVINCFKIYYPKYLSKIIIFEMPWIMNAAFKIVKGWLGPDAINTLRLVNRNEIQDFISSEYLPPHMGGTDPFKYSYPPLPDDDFQTPMCENGPITSDDDMESREESEADTRDAVDSCTSEENVLKPKKLNCTEDHLKHEDSEKADTKLRNRRTSSVFKGPLLHISPADELHFGSKESGERKCVIVLNNVTKNTVAFKVRTTAPDKYRVKPSNSSCEPGSTVDIVVSLHAASTASLQDRFLVMAAEMEQSSSSVGAQDLAHFWKEVPRNKIMEHRLRCHVVESSKPSTLALKGNALNRNSLENDDLQIKLNQLVESNRRLEEQMRHCVWYQHLIAFLLSVLVAIVFFGLYSGR